MSEKQLTEEQLRKEAEDFADEMHYSNSHECADEIDRLDYMVEYLTAKILGKDPYKCFCGENYQTRKLEDGTEICCNCEKPINK